MAWIALRNPNSKRLLPFSSLQQIHFYSSSCRALLSPACSSIIQPLARIATSSSPHSWWRSFATAIESKPQVNVGAIGHGHGKTRLPPTTKKALAGLRRIDLEGLRWRVFDAKGQVLGRLASQISIVLQGKDKPTYTPNRDDADMCIVLNAKDICVTGRKLTDKFYRWHTGYVGNLKERSLKDQMAKDPTEVIRKAVLRMLPRNKLRDDRDRKLRIFANDEHPFGDRPLEPYVMPPRKVREMRPRARRAMIRAQKRAEQQEAGTASRKNGKNEKEKMKVSA